MPPTSNKRPVLIWQLSRKRRKHSNEIDSFLAEQELHRSQLAENDSIANVYRVLAHAMQVP